MGKKNTVVSVLGNLVQTVLAEVDITTGQIVNRTTIKNEIIKFDEASVKELNSRIEEARGTVAKLFPNGSK